MSLSAIEVAQNIRGECKQRHHNHHDLDSGRGWRVDDNFWLACHPALRSIDFDDDLCLFLESCFNNNSDFKIVFGDLNLHLHSISCRLHLGWFWWDRLIQTTDFCDWYQYISSQTVSNNTINLLFAIGWCSIIREHMTFYPLKKLFILEKWHQKE